MLWRADVLAKATRELSSAPNPDSCAVFGTSVQSRLCIESSFEGGRSEARVRALDTDARKPCWWSVRRQGEISLCKARDFRLPASTLFTAAQLMRAV